MRKRFQFQNAQDVTFFEVLQAKACETFTADRLFEQIDDILGGIRTVVLSLANGGGSKKFRRSQKSEKLPEKVILAMQAIVKTLCSHPNPAVIFS